MAGARVDQLVAERRDELTPAERRVADVVVSDPEAIAFGTVATVARSARSSGASVVRLAGRLGFDGFTDLQDAVRAELARRLRPATQRIREPAPGDTVGEVLQASLDAVHGTLDAVDPDQFRRVVAAVGKRSASVWLICGDASDGIGRQAADQLAVLRPGVTRVAGNPVHVAGHLAAVNQGDVVLALDLRRYDRWVVDWAEAARLRGAIVIALTDSHVSSLAERADEVLIVAAESAGPFDTYVGALALFDAIVAGVARRSRAAATATLDRIEEAWQGADVLME
jgi:DNA-binding MurR/RpiR family transcriptional regulator